ncbi:MAG: AAA family ATPase [Ardenticatenaceae bacterium]|nr:AAA family ATPase [Ardenticatenaceae bacterium]
MSSLSDKIIDWSKSLPYWEQSALQKIIDGVEFTRPVYTELLGYLLEDAGLKEPAGKRPTLNISQKIEASVLQPSQNRYLKRMFGVQNVNALASGQELSFSPNLTVIYGNNGSGKSGYARIIGNTAFTRGDKQVLMDVTKQYDPSLPQTVCFEIEDDNGSKTIEHHLGQQCYEMDMFHVFDSTSARVHLTKQNTLSFVPAGLQYLTQLAEVTDVVRSRLSQEVEKRRQQNHFIDHFSEDTEVKTVISNLNAQTDIVALRKMSNLSNQESARLETIDKGITSFQTQNVLEEIKQIELKISDLQKLITKLETLAKALDQEKIQSINEQISEWAERNTLVSSLSRKSTNIGTDIAIGTSLWLQFVESAHQLATNGERTEQAYPQSGDVCLLCNQPLSPSAMDHIERLWSILESDALTGFQNLDLQLQNIQAEIDELELDFFNDQLVSYRHLQRYDQNVLVNIQEIIETFASIRQEIILGIINKQPIGSKPAPKFPLDKVNQLIFNLEKEAIQLKETDTRFQVARLKEEKIRLQHRQKLAKLMPDIEKYVNNEIWIVQAESSKTKRSTRHISQQFNALFDELVTQRYIQLFTENLERLNFRASVQVNTRGRKGETLKQIVLQMDESVPTGQVQTEKVLSEGEQKAVALADFLTEVALDEVCSGIVLDDPVTSLDFDWKDLIAPLLVKEASQKQVVILTHDLHFLYCLKEAASNTQGIDLVAHWIEKRDGIPGWIFQNNTPLSEGDYKSTHKAQTYLEQAKQASPELQQTFLQAGFGALRTNYEAFVIFDLFGSVVMRFGERISIDRLKYVYINPDIKDTVIQKVGFLSRYIEGHLHSDAYILQKPTPDLLKQEIDEFNGLKKRHKDYLKEMGTK